MKSRNSPQKDVDVETAAVDRNSPAKPSTTASGLHHMSTRHDDRVSDACIPSSGHTSVAMMVQLQEYKDCIREACATTFQHALKPPLKANDSRPRSTPHRKRSYCRSYVMQSNRITEATREITPSPRFTTPIPIKDHVLPRQGQGYNEFHRMSNRDDKFLFGTHSNLRYRFTPNGALEKNPFSLGPGQYDAKSRKEPMPINFCRAPERFPSCTVKEPVGTAEYSSNNSIVQNKGFEFDHTPRKMGHEKSLSTTPFSSYYYRPRSDFDQDNRNLNTSSWSRASRFQIQRRHLNLNDSRKSTKQPVTDFVERNKAFIPKRKSVLKSPRVKRVNARNEEEERQVERNRTSVIRENQEQEYDDTFPSVIERGMVGGLLVITAVASFQKRMIEIRRFTGAMTLIQRAYNRHLESTTFIAWKFCRGARGQWFATNLIAKNVFLYKFRIRVQKKVAHAQILRSFLSGLTVEARFWIAIQKMRKHVCVLQRWWRRMTAISSARFEMQLRQWTKTETRLRNEYLNQRSQLYKVFQLHINDNLPSSLLQQLNVPSQANWFQATFSLSGEGWLRAYDLKTHELLVELRGVRCFMDDRLSEINTSAGNKTYLFLFKPGTYRLLLLTTPSEVTTELVSWKDKMLRITQANASACKSQNTLPDLTMTQSEASSSSPTRKDNASSNVSRASIARNGNASRNTRVASLESEFLYYVVDLYKDMPRIPLDLTRMRVREIMADKKAHYRQEMQDYGLAQFQYEQHCVQMQQLQVFDNFKSFLVMSPPEPPRFMTLLPTTIIEQFVRKAIERTKRDYPHDPQKLLDRSS